MAAEEPQSIYLLSIEIGVSGFQPYVLDLDILGMGVGEVHRVMAFVVLMRQDGILLALPDGALDNQVLFAANVVGSQEVFGPSTKVEVSCALLDEEELQSASQLLAGQVIDVPLVDASSDIYVAITPLTPGEDLE